MSTRPFPIAEQAQTDCRHFNGYKPCGKNEVCSANCPSKERAWPRILVVHLEALGAVLRATVVLSAIKREWPHAHVTWMTSPLASALLENNPSIDRLLKNDHAGTLTLSTLSFDFGFCIDKSHVAAALLNTPHSIKEKRGFGVDASTGAIIPLNEQAKRLWELGLSNHEKFFVNTKPETQLIIESLGLKFKNDEYSFEFTQSEKQHCQAEFERIIGKKELKSPAIGLNTGCSCMLPHKKLTVQGWVALVNEIHKRFPKSPLLLLGGPEDTKRNEEIAWHSDHDLIQTPTETGLRNGLVYVDLCDIVVTGDSLGLHMAIALKKWVVCWFGPSCLHEIDFYGRGIGVKTKAGCSPCWKRQCEKPIMCYDQVPWSEMISGIQSGVELWKTSNPSVSWSSRPRISATSFSPSRSSESSSKL